MKPLIIDLLGGEYWAGLYAGIVFLGFEATSWSSLDVEEEVVAAAAVVVGILGAEAEGAWCLFRWDIEEMVAVAVETTAAGAGAVTGADVFGAMLPSTKVKRSWSY